MLKFYEQITGWIVESENGVTVAVDTQLTKDLSQGWENL
jgi:hypothetical protein